MKKWFWNKKGEKGQALVIALLILGIGAILSVPVLSLMGTGLTAVKTYDEKALEIYATDAGIEEAIWRIQNRDEVLVYYFDVGESIGNTHSGTLYTFWYDTVGEENPDDMVQIGLEENPLYFYLDQGESGAVNDYDIKATIAILPKDIYKITATAYDPDEYNVGNGNMHDINEANSDLTTIVTHIALHINLGAFEGALVSSGSVTIKMPTTIDGDILWGTDFVVKSGDEDDFDNEQISDEQMASYFPPDDELIAFAQDYEDEAKLGENISDEEKNEGLYIKGENEKDAYTYEIGDGEHGAIIYGDLDVGSWVTLNVKGSVLYVTGSITFRKDAAITGGASVIALGDIVMRKMNDYTDNTDAIIFSLYGNITFMKELDIHALIYAPNGDIQFDKSATIVGSVISGGNIISGDIYSDNNLNITYDPIYADMFELPGYIEGIIVLTYEINPV